jgi:hypothetical protein
MGRTGILDGADACFERLQAALIELRAALQHLAL